jgi:hypothetical protein
MGKKGNQTYNIADQLQLWQTALRQNSNTPRAGKLTGGGTEGLQRGTFSYNLASYYTLFRLDHKSAYAFSQDKTAAVPQKPYCSG